MTSEKLKPTPGPWLLDSNYAEDWDTPNHELNTSTSSQAILSPDDEIVAFAVVSYDEWNDPVKEAQLTANALLIAQAGTVFHECGLSPRELLDKNQDYKAQNARLTVALRNLCKHFPTDADMAELGWEVEYVETACQAYDTARAVLATQKE